MKRLPLLSLGLLEQEDGLKASCLNLGSLSGSTYEKALLSIKKQRLAISSPFLPKQSLSKQG